MYDHDPELPRGYQDADLEMASLQEAGNTIARLRKRGICTHGWIQGPPGPASKPTTVWTCHHCGKTWPTEVALRDEEEEIKERYF